MNISPPKKMPPPPPPPPQPHHLPDNLIVEALSWLPVKSLTRFRCVCKSWNALITSNPTFIHLHLQRSALQNPQILLPQNRSGRFSKDFAVISFSGSGL